MGVILVIVKYLYYNNNVSNLIYFILFGLLIYLVLLILFKTSREDIIEIFNLIK